MALMYVISDISAISGCGKLMSLFKFSWSSNLESTAKHMPTQEEPYTPPAIDGTTKPTRPMLSWIEVVVIMVIILFFTALLLPAVRMAREQQMYRYNNHLRMLSLGIHNYESIFRCFPPAYTQDSHGNRLHSWRSLILPYIEQSPSFNAIDFSASWDSSQNLHAQRLLEQPSCLQCPVLKYASPGFTVFHASVGEAAFFGPLQGRLKREITDPAEQTLMMVEVHHQYSVPVMKPEDLSTSQLCTTGYPWAPRHFSDKFYVALADGSLRDIAVSTDPQVFYALTTINGDENSTLGEVPTH